MQKFFYCLRRLFSIPSLVLVNGKWRTGKTDMSLLISELLLKMKLVSMVGSNIQIDNDKTYDYITSLTELKYWLHKNRRRKLYILDEANVHLFRRDAMTKKTTTFIKLLGEVSKAHAKIIIIGQEIEEIDSILLNPTWCRGIINKLSKTKAEIKSKLIIPNYIKFTGIPKTRLKFDPDNIAPFTQQPEEGIKRMFKDEEKRLLWRWSTGESCEKLGLHPMQLNRKVRKFVKGVLEPSIDFHL